MMKQINLLLGIRFRSLAASLLQRGKNKANGIGAMILLGVLFGFVFVVFGFTFFSFFLVMREAAAFAGTDTSLYLSLAAALTLALCLFGSTFTAQSELYQAKDTEFLLSMPLRPGAIFASRLLLLVILNVLYGSVVALPALIVYCLYDFTVPGLLLFLFFFTLILFVALAISCLLGWLIALISSRIKRKNLITMLFSIAFFALYMVGVTAMSTFMENIDTNIHGFAQAAGPILAIFTPISAGILGTDLLASLLFALFSLGAITLVATLLIRSYLSILTANRGGVQYTYREKKAKQASAFFSLLRRELHGFLGAPMYMLNAGLGLIMTPLAAIFLLAYREDLALIAASPSLAFIVPLFPALIAGASIFLTSTVTISAPSLSLEAKTLWMLKTMPLSARTVLLAKATFQVLISAPFFLLFSILAAIALSAGPLEILGLLLLPQLGSAFCAFFGVTMGFLFPKFDWNNPTAVIKSGAALAITMFGMMIVGLLSNGFLVGLSILGLPVWIAMLLLALALFLGTVGFYAYLSSRAAERRYARLQN